MTIWLCDHVASIAGVSQVSCEPDMVHILDMARPRTAQLPPGTALTIQTFQLGPSTGPGLATLPSLDKVKLEPGLLQPLPPEAKPLKVEVQDTYLDSGEGLLSRCQVNEFRGTQ